ncbi:hypothetical protein Gotur_016244, partial [Gossypium turneri]
MLRNLFIGIDCGNIMANAPTKAGIMRPSLFKA